MGALLVLALVLLAAGFTRHRGLRPFAFTVWVFAGVAASLVYPWAFGTWFGWDLRHLIVPLVQVIMFGMGTTLSVRDFTRVLALPWPVFLGLALQFSIMPLLGLGIASAFGFPAEVAAGVILIGSVSGGVASNLMTYLAGGHVALSVTMTACSTLLSPLATPFLMKTLAGRMVPIDFVAMVLEILNMVIVPVVTGLLAHRLLYGEEPRWRRPGVLTALGLSGLGLAVGIGVLPTSLWGSLATLKGGLILGCFLLGTVALARLLVARVRADPKDWMDRALPVVSMVGICLIIAIITARSSDRLLTIGPALVLAAMLHNTAGYGLGYALARALGLEERVCRTIAFEVGMQNGGMASGLAMNVLKSVDAALAPAIFGPWMNVSGSVLATWWRRSPPRGRSHSPPPPTPTP